jgi:hypothetical protein
MNKKIIILFLSLLLISQVSAQLTLFYGDGCPHCAEEEEFLVGLQERHPELVIEMYEVWYNESNAKNFKDMSELHGVEARYVPATYYEDYNWVGFNENIGREIEEKISQCNEGICDPQDEQNNTVNIPFFGDVDVQETGLFVFTIMMGTLDGFNACAMWVLCFLLSLLLYSKSRKHVFFIGGTFILVSGIVYFMFMAAWMNAFMFAGHLRWIQLLIATLAIIFGLINIKEYFFFGKGISFMIPKDKKSDIIKRMRGLVNPKTGFLMTLVGVASLAFMVNLIELLCTTGLPAIYTSALAQFNLPWYSNYLYLLLYIVMYMIDDFIIFSIVVTTMSSKKFTEKYGRISKLISGLIILVLGLIMIINPKLLMFG